MFIKSRIFLPLCILFIIVSQIHCTKSGSQPEPTPNPTPTPIPPPNISKTCIVASISQQNSGNKPEFFQSITFNSSLNPTRISIYDSAANSQIFEANLTYASSDSIRIDTFQYFKLDNNKRIIGFITKEDMSNPNKSDYYRYEYKYSTDGYLITKNLYINRNSNPTFTTNYNYSNGLLVNCIMVIPNVGSKKVFESAITYDESISPKTMFYTFTDGFESYPYSSVMNFGTKPTKPPKQIITKIYDPSNNLLLDTWTSNYNGYTLDNNGYLSFGIASGDQQQGLAYFFGKTTFRYLCQ